MVSNSSARLFHCYEEYNSARPVTRHARKAGELRQYHMWPEHQSAPGSSTTLTSPRTSKQSAGPVQFATESNAPRLSTAGQHIVSISPFEKKIYKACPRRNVPEFGRVFLMLKYTDITQNTYIQSWTVTEIMARELWNFDSCYILTDYQIHIKTGTNVLFL